MVLPFSSSDAPQADVVAKDVTAASFKADVLDASANALVAVAFWTPRDSLCVQVASGLEKLARESKGAVKVARVDVDRFAAIAQQLGVRSAPSVVAFYQGRLIDAFAGALSEAQMKAWLAQLMKMTGAEPEGTPGLDAALEQAEAFLAEGDRMAARSIYAEILEAVPENAAAFGGLVRCSILDGDLEKARKTLDGASPALAKDKALDSVRAALELAEQAASSKGRADSLVAVLKDNPDDHQARFDLALARYAEGNSQEALDLLLDLVRRARSWNEDAARKQLIKFFEALGSSHPLTVAARKRLSSLLFS